jgi:hypothetical protein
MRKQRDTPVPHVIGRYVGHGQVQKDELAMYPNPNSAILGQPTE